MERVPVISEIADVIDSRKGGDPKVSYVAKLFSKAPDAALKKVGEEATERRNLRFGRKSESKRIVRKR